MKKRIALLFVLVVFIAVWMLLYAQYKEYIATKDKPTIVESATHVDKKDDDKNYVNVELFDYLNEFLFKVIDGQFGIIVGKSGIARMDYKDDQVNLIEAVTIQDDAYSNIERAIEEFYIPTFQNLTQYEKKSLQTIYDEIQGVKEAYQSQIMGQKGLTFALAMEKGEDSLNVEAYSYEEQMTISQRMVDESLDEIIAFHVKVDALCHEIIERMEKK